MDLEGDRSEVRGGPTYEPRLRSADRTSVLCGMQEAIAILVIDGTDFSDVI